MSTTQSRIVSGIREPDQVKPVGKNNFKLHEIKVVQPKVDRTDNKTPSLPVVGIK